MSQSKSMTSTIYSSTAPIPSSSPTSGTAQRIGELIPQARQPTPPETGGFILPATGITGFVGGGGAQNSYTYNRNRENSSNRHQTREPAWEPARAYAYGQIQAQAQARAQAQVQAQTHEHDGKTSGVPSVPFNGGIPVGNTNINHNNFHYHQKSRRHSDTTTPLPGDDTGGNTYPYLGEHVGDFDDDIDRDGDDDYENEDRDRLAGRNNWFAAGNLNEDGKPHQEPSLSELEKVASNSSGGGYGLQRNVDDSSVQQAANNGNKNKGLGLGQLQDQFHHRSQQSRIRQSVVGSDFSKLMDNGSSENTDGHNLNPSLSPTNLNRFTEHTTAIATATTATSDPIEPKTRGYQQHPPRTNHYNYQKTATFTANGQQSVSNLGGHGSESRPSRPQDQMDQQQKPHPRAASSSAFYNKSHSKSTSTSRSPVSPPWTRTRTSPPTAPPRVSSLLPPPRNKGSTAISTLIGTTNSPRLPLSSSNSPVTPIPEQSVSPAAAATTNPTSPSGSNLATSSTINSNQHPNSSASPKSKSNANAVSSTNDFLRQVPTHAQFATSFLDPLNKFNKRPTASDSNNSSASASDLGPAPAPGPNHRRSHSRSSSIGAVGDSLRNLNRWSSSTASSRLSGWDYHHYQQQQAQQQKLSSFSRRMSVDSIGLLSQHSDAIQDISSFTSPRKFEKRRLSQSTTGASPKTYDRTRADSASTSHSAGGFGGGAGSGALSNDYQPFSAPPFPPPSGPPPNLPPIVSLPPLDADESGFGLGSPTPRAMSRASPALNTPTSVFATHAEPRDYFRGDFSNPTRTGSPGMRTNTTLLPPASVTGDRGRDASQTRGHSRSRSTAKGSGDSSKNRERSAKPSQKAMLSKALNKANSAVKLDNDTNYTAAREAYIEACVLLQQVLARTNGEDDRKKLEAIRHTYTSRIDDLNTIVLDNLGDDKALPARPDSPGYHGVHLELAGGDSQSDAATITRSTRDPSPNLQISSHPTTIYSDFSRTADTSQGLLPPFSGPAMRRHFEGGSLTIPRSDAGIVPAPLSPFRPTTPAAKAPTPEPIVRQDFSMGAERERQVSDYRAHGRNLSHESASWLDPIDESGGSVGSSVHSRSSSRIIRKHIRQPSGNTEAEFDAALDAAVEAAYDDGYEPMEPPSLNHDEDEDNVMAASMRKVELARERVRETGREMAIETARGHERQRQMSLGQDSQVYGGFFDANDSDEEEERMLEEMTRGYVMEDFTLNQKPRYQSSVPRESDSSGLTSRTWHSSMGSNPATGTTTLTTVSEMASQGNSIDPSSLPSMPPPTQSLPQPPTNRLSTVAGMRNRRISSQNTKQLKIETSKLGPAPTVPLAPSAATSSAASSAVPPKPSGNYIAQQRQALSATSTRGPFSTLAPASPVRGISPAEAPAHTPMSPVDDEDEEYFGTGSPTAIGPGMRKNFSSSSLKSLKSRQLSLSHGDEHDPSPVTPLSRQISNTSVTRQPVPALPTPLATTFAEKMTGGGFGGLHLFDSDFHAPDVQSPGSSHGVQQQSPDVPLPLEPCPSEAMFRPFWLMRALYQTLAHPRGGYISNKLFVPREAWNVKGVKLRNVEDKVSACDLLTAALLKLARVDSTDADALLDEMQSFENYIETVQGTLTRRLGGEVGTQGMNTLKEEKESEPALIPRNNSVSVKAGAFSWRRLRSKGSAVNLAATYSVKSATNGMGAGVAGIPEKEVTSSGGSIPSLPMVAHPSSRPAKRDVASVKFDGPNANYMASLARLFDAAQIVDQIARQVDDPGLRHADKTQVGLELCTRHAAEFFGFYICRWVLADLSMLLDKFVKRGSEWVLS